MSILIFSTAEDPHAQAVIEALGSYSGKKVELLNLSNFPTRLSLTMAFGETRRLSLGGHEAGRLDLTKVKAAWWRRPQAFVLPEHMTDPVQQEFALAEATTAFKGLYQTMPAFWVNDPIRNAAASHKPFQLAVAQDAGWQIPETLITSDPAEARAFWSSHPGRMVYKPFTSGTEAWRETRILRSEEAENAEGIRLAPVIFQHYVEATAELRVIAVGDDLFAGATDLADAEYPADVRLNLGLRYRKHDLPIAVQEQVHALMRRLGLHYGALDLRLTPEGQYVFLEINPAGQFLYIEQLTGLPIAAALASKLASA